ncbi:MAG: hypothetical protein FWG53_06495 [Clostridiales bacterium]|nr:hypothetical protein [Clostridiales bacterium]
MNQNEIENVNSDNTNESDAIKKPKQLWQILFLIFGSLLSVFLFIDITSGILGGLGFISFFNFLLTPALFAFPIIIRKSKLLIIPSALFPLSFIIISIAIFHPNESLGIIQIFCLVSAFIAAFGIVAGFLIRLFRSRKSKAKIIFMAIGGLVLLTPMLFIAIFISGILLPNPPLPEIKYAEFPFRIEIEYNDERLVFEDTIICEYAGVGIYGYYEGKSRRWISRFASGREYDATWPTIEMLDTDSVLMKFHSGEPAFYMDRPYYELEHGIPYSPSRPSIFVDDKALRARGEFSFSFYDLPSQEERLRTTLENFGIEIISIELTPPIENTYQ